MQRLHLAALTAFVLSAPSNAKEFFPDELFRCSVERRAVEAVIWGMPAVNYERMLQATVASGAKPNEVV